MFAYDVFGEIVVTGITGETIGNIKSIVDSLSYLDTRADGNVKIGI
jgi:hypothetical protein